MDNTKPKKYNLFLKIMFLLLWLVSVFLVIVLLDKPDFAQTEAELWLGFECLNSPLYIISLWFNSYFYGVYSIKNVILMSLFQMSLFYITFALIFTIKYKFSFLKSKHKLTKAIGFLFVSIFAFILGDIVYNIGTLVSCYEKETLWSGTKIICTFTRSTEFRSIASVLIIVDILYLIFGLIEYIFSKNKLTFKENIKMFFKDKQNKSFLILFVFTLIYYLIFFIFNGGIDFIEVEKVFLR